MIPKSEREVLLLKKKKVSPHGIGCSDHTPQHQSMPSGKQTSQDLTVHDINHVRQVCGRETQIRTTSHQKEAHTSTRTNTHAPH